MAITPGGQVNSSRTNTITVTPVGTVWLHVNRVQRFSVNVCRSVNVVTTSSTARTEKVGIVQRPTPTNNGRSQRQAGGVTSASPSRTAAPTLGASRHKWVINVKVVFARHVTVKCRNQRVNWQVITRIARVVMWPHPGWRYNNVWVTIRKNV